MKGVTQAVFNEYFATEGLRPRSVRLITDAEVAAIYRTDTPTRSDTMICRQE